MEGEGGPPPLNISPGAAVGLGDDPDAAAPGEVVGGEDALAALGERALVEVAIVVGDVAPVAAGVADHQG